MNHSIHDIFVNQFSRNLRSLRTLLNKAQEHAKARNFDPNLFLQTRLAPDMFPLVRQVQMITDNAKGAAARLSGKTLPVYKDEEKSIEELIARVDKTIDYLASFNEADFKEYKNQQISFPWNPGNYLKGADYLTAFAIPNFYFHLTTAYNLLRANGVDIGKKDFLGEVNWIKQ